MKPTEVTLAELRQALAGLPTGEPVPPRDGTPYAAVALALAGSDAAPELCVIRRAEREGDPWSGHMALPGGKGDPEDATPRAAAMRETMEEVGVSLERAAYVGALNQSPIYAGGQDTGLKLFPFVFFLGENKPPLVPNHEVAEAFWVPLAHIFDRGNHEKMPYHRNGERHLFPSVRFRGHFIWGVTYRVLVQLGDLLSRPLPPPVPRP